MKGLDVNGSDSVNTCVVPSGLGSAGAQLYTALVDAFGTPTPVRAAILRQAAAEADLVDRLHEAVSAAPLVVAGTAGQPAPHPLLTEVRLHRVALRRLLRAVDPAARRGRPMSTAEARRVAASRRFRGVANRKPGR